MAYDTKKNPYSPPQKSLPIIYFINLGKGVWMGLEKYTGQMFSFPCKL